MSMSSKVEEWRGGFGFCRLADGRRAFLHVSTIAWGERSLPNIVGREVRVVRVATSAKGLQVTEAVLLPRPEDWKFAIGDVYAGALRYKVCIASARTEPKLDEGQITAARAEGCPEAVIQQAVQSYERDRSAWQVKHAEECDFEAAKDAARNFAKSLPDNQAVIVYPIGTPKATQPLEKGCVEEFGTNWESVFFRLVPKGSNAHYTWASLSVDEANALEIRGRFKHSWMEYKFEKLDWAASPPTRVFIGKLTCGDNSPHESRW